MESIQIFGIVWMAMAAAIGVWGVLMVVRAVRGRSESTALRQTGVETIGTIVDSQTETRNNGGRRSTLSFRPIVRFRTADDHEHTAVGPAPSNRSFVNGVEAPIRYDPADPTKIEIMAGHGRGSGRGGALATGLVLAVVSVVFLTVGWQIQRRHDVTPANPTACTVWTVDNGKVSCH